MIKKTVEQWLKDVDYKIDPTYTPSKFALEFINFIKLINGVNGEENQTPILHYKMLDNVASRKKNIANMLFRGASKALDLNTLVMTPTGYILLKDLHIDDYVIDRYGKATKIIAESDIFTNQTYIIKLTDGSSFIANEDHLHIIHRRSTRKKNTTGQITSYWREEVLTTKEILDHGISYPREITTKNPKERDLKWYIPLISVPAQFAYSDFPLDPYTVGVILGNGNVGIQGTPLITSHINDVHELRSYLPYKLGNIYHDKRRYSTTSFRIHKLDPLVKKYIGHKSAHEKSIPHELLFGTEHERIEVLRGLMDTDGTCSANGYSSFASASEALALGVRHIVKSLGGYSKITRHENDFKGYYLVTVNLTDRNPFKLIRKASKWKPDRQHLSGTRVGIESIEPTDSIIPTKCIAVASPSKSFLIEDVILTHNTTVFGDYLFLYLAVFGSIPDFGVVDFALYVTDSIDHGVRNMRKSLEHRREQSDFLREYIPEIRFTDNRWEFTNKDGKKLIVRGYGARTGVRGARELGKRPSLAVMDDLINEEDAKSDTLLNYIEEIVYSAINFALHPTHSKVIWNGTPFNSKDPLYKAIESGAWYVNVFPICEEYPCKKKDYRGAWEDRFPYEYVKGEYEKALALGTVHNFNQELMLQIMSEEERIIQDEDIMWYKRSVLLLNKGNFNYFITTDFATSEELKSDFSVILVWALNYNNDWFLVDGIVKKQLMNNNIDDLFRLVQIYNPLQVGVEVSGQQGGFVRWIYDEMLRRNIYFSFASKDNKSKPGIRPLTNKMQRFNIVVPWFKTRKVWFPEELAKGAMVTEILNELRLISAQGFKSKYDDCIDAISQLAALQYFVPSQEVSLEEERETVQNNFMWDADLDNKPINRYSSYII